MANATIGTRGRPASSSRPASSWPPLSRPMPTRKMSAPLPLRGAGRVRVGAVGRSQAGRPAAGGWHRARRGRRRGSPSTPPRHRPAARCPTSGGTGRGTATPPAPAAPVRPGWRPAVPRGQARGRRSGATARRRWAARRAARSRPDRRRPGRRPRSRGASSTRHDPQWRMPVCTRPDRQRNRSTSPTAAQRLGRGEVGEPGVEALDAPGGRSSRCCASRRASTTAMPRWPQPPEAALRQPDHLVAPALVGDERTICCTDTRAVAGPVPHRRRGRSSRCTGTFHQSAWLATRSSVRGPVPPMTTGIRPGRHRALRAAVEREELAVEGHLLAAPQQLAAPGASRPAGRPAPAAWCRTTPKVSSSVGHRAPADAELEAAAAGVVEGDRLAGQHRRVAERVAQHEVADRRAARCGRPATWPWSSPRTSAGRRPAAARGGP